MNFNSVIVFSSYDQISPLNNDLALILLLFYYI